MLVLGALGVEEEQTAHGALLAISLGLILAAPTALTGLFDWLDIRKGTPARTVATIHLWPMVTATVLFALTWLAQLDGYKDDEVRGLALALGLAAFAFLALGGNIGGANVFVYGIRVLRAEDTPPGEALNPFASARRRRPGGCRNRAPERRQTMVRAATSRRDDRPKPPRTAGFSIGPDGGDRASPMALRESVLGERNRRGTTADAGEVVGGRPEPSADSWVHGPMENAQ